MSLATMSSPPLEPKPIPADYHRADDPACTCGVCVMRRLDSKNPRN